MRLRTSAVFNLRRDFDLVVDADDAADLAGVFEDNVSLEAPVDLAAKLHDPVLNGNLDAILWTEHVPIEDVGDALCDVRVACFGLPIVTDV